MSIAMGAGAARAKSAREVENHSTRRIRRKLTSATEFAWAGVHVCETRYGACVRSR